VIKAQVVKKTRRSIVAFRDNQPGLRPKLAGSRMHQLGQSEACGGSVQSRQTRARTFAGERVNN
jgi:hypothetical protein